VRLRTDADAARLQAESPDAIILATGVAPADPPTLFEEAGVPVLTTWALMDEPPARRGRVLLVDDGTGFWEVCGAADLLVEQGARIAFATPNAVIGRSIPHESLGLLHSRLRRGGTLYHPFTELRAARNGIATLVDTVTQEEWEMEVDCIVLQVQRRPSAHPAFAKGHDLPVHVIGDGLYPRRLTHATFEANRAIRELI
jgi:hypothetical protein